jgi:hypothetical protein
MENYETITLESPDEQTMFDLIHSINERISQETPSVSDMLETLSVSEILDTYDYPADYTSELVLVTPEMAQKWIDESEYNLKPNSNLERYTRDMVNGEWFITGDPISFDSKGLFNGVTRLAAIIKSGVPQTMMIVRGLTDRAIFTTDLARNRTTGDVFTIEHLNLKNHTLVVSLVKMCQDFEDNYYFGKPKGPRSHSISLDWYQNLPDHDFFHKRITEANTFYKNSETKLKPREFAFLHYTFSLISLEDSTRFMNHICGVNVQDGSPAVVFAEKVTSYRNDKTKKLSNSDLIKYALIAWHKFRIGEHVTILRLPTVETDYKTFLI